MGCGTVQHGSIFEDHHWSKALELERQKDSPPHRTEFDRVLHAKLAGSMPATKLGTCAYNNLCGLA